jgi:hypothetical protein
MTEQDGVPGRIRPTIMAGNGDTTFVDLSDLHPVNEVSAVVGGGAGGALLGGMGGAAVAALKKDMEAGAKAAEHVAPKYAKYAIIGGTVSAIIGGVISWLNAKTHNNWSDRVTAKALENKTDQAPGRQ